MSSLLRDSLTKVDDQWSLTAWFISVLLCKIQQTAPCVNIWLRSICGKWLPSVEIGSYFISLLVSELFMTLFIPYCIVNIDVQFARLLMLLFAFNLFVCNVMKNMLKLPRPTIKTTYERGVGYGFPSSHSAITISLLRFTSKYSEMTPGWQALSPYITFGFTILIGMARLVLGVHSVPDVLGGYVIGEVLMQLFMIMVQYGILDYVVTTLAFGPMLLPIAMMVTQKLLYAGFRRGVPTLHAGLLETPHAGLLETPHTGLPATRRGSGSEPRDESIIRKEAISVFGCAIGTMLSMWRESICPWSNMTSGYVVSYTELSTFDKAVRYAIAMVTVSIAKLVSNRIVVRFTSKYSAMTRASSDGPTVLSVGTPHSEIANYIIRYSLMTWIIFDLLPHQSAKNEDGF